MGFTKPREVQAAKVNESYNWGNQGHADANGVHLGQQSQKNLDNAQAGVGQYLNEMLNPSYNNASFKAREDLINQKNQQMANEMGADAIARGARGSATQNILDSISANRNNDLRNAMTQEDARLRNILQASQGVEGQYMNQMNTMANNILQRATQNQNAQNQANQTNTANYNNWKNKMIKTVGGAVGAGSMFIPGIGPIVSGVINGATNNMGN